MSDFTILVGTNSFGPLNGPIHGDGSGFFDGSTNGGHSCGSSTPSPCYAGGSVAQVSCLGWAGDTGGKFVVVLYGTHAQNYFSSVAVGAPANLSFTSASALGFDNTTYPGFTCWWWNDSHEFSFIGDNLDVTFSGFGIAISPTNPTCNFGASIPFSESGDDGNGVTWTVNGEIGGDPTIGTINAFGVYLAPTQAQVGGAGGPFSVTVGVYNTDNPAQEAQTTVTFNLPTIQAFGAFRGPKAFRPVSLTNVGSINPKIYAPGENTTVKSQS